MNTFVFSLLVSRCLVLVPVFDARTWYVPVFKPVSVSHRSQGLELGSIFMVLSWLVSVSRVLISVFSEQMSFTQTPAAPQYHNREEWMQVFFVP